MSLQILQKIIARNYPIVAPTIFLRQTISEEQYEQIAPLWGYVLDPYRESDCFYVLTFSPGEDPCPLIEYLELNKMKYSLEIILTEHDDLI